MSAPRRSLLALCQTTTTAALVATLCLPALGVIALDIVPTVPPTGASAPSAAEPQTRIATSPQDTARSAVSTEPVKPKVSEVALEEKRVEPRREPSEADPEPEADSELVSRPIEVDGFATVGVTWAPGRKVAEDDLTISLRTKRQGAWTPWEELHHDPDHLPDPGSPDAAASARPGTDALVVGHADSVRVRVQAAAGQAPRDLELAVIDPGVDRTMARESGDALEGTIATGGTTGSGDASLAATLTAGTAPRPTIFSRSQWGANESLRDKGSLRYGTINAGFVHHTVNSNGYSRSQVPAIIRGIYAYHTQSRGWSDVGYNFLVDRFGRIWEGRYGGVSRPVVGAHTLGYNDYAFAMSAIGNFDVTGAPSAMLDAYGRLFAWKLSLHGVDASSTRQRVGSSYFPAISGHRDAGQTACPGRYLYAKLADIRTRATQIQKGGGGTPTPAPTLGPGSDPRTNLSGARWPDVASRRNGALTLNRTGGQIAFRDHVSAGQGWAGKDLVAAVGDMTGDGLGDLVARNRPGQSASLFAGNGRGGFGPRSVRDYQRLAGVDRLLGVGDFDGDGNDDLVGRDGASGRLLLHRGRDGAGLRPALALARSWSYPLTVAGGDVDGDRRPDLLVRSGATLSLVRGLGDRIASPVELPRRWGGYDRITGGYDLSGDGVDDLLARERSTGLSYIFPGDGEGDYGRRFGPFDDFRSLDWFAIGGQLAKGKGRDVVGIHSGTGQLRVVGNTGRQNLGRTILPGLGLRGADAVFPVGDWNGDKRGDLMYREADNGRLMFVANKGGDDFAAPVVAGTGFDGVTGLVAAGDVTGDGRADLMGENTNGVVRVYPGDGRSGFRDGFAADRGNAASPGRHSGVVLRKADGSVWLWRLTAGGGPMSSKRLVADSSGYDWFRAAGDVDGDGRPDVLARVRATKLFYMLPVSSTGLGARRFVSEDLGDRDLAG